MVSKKTKIPKNKTKKYKILDLFVWWEDETQAGKINIDITKKGAAFFAEKKKLDKNFNEQEYLQNFFTEALTSFLNADNKKTSD